MKGFFIAFSLSAALMLGLVYAMVVNPTLFTSLFGVNSTETEITIDETQETISETVEPPASYQKQIDKGMTLFDEGHYELAAEAFEAATALSPESAEAYIWLGKTLRAEGASEDAKTAIEVALALDPENVEIQLLYAQILMELGAMETAETNLVQIENPDARVIYARALIKAYTGDYETATTLFQTVIDSGESSELSQHADNFLNSMSEFALAEDAPESYRQTLIARSLAETDENTLAIELLYTILKTEPDYRDAWIILGYVYLDQEKYADAEEALLKAVELDPTKAETRYFLGLSYFGQADYASAVLQLELAIESGFEPRVQAYQKLGDAAVLINDYAKAVDAYENVLVLNSSDVNLYIRPIWLYLDHLDNPKAAEGLAEDALAEHPDTAMAYNLMGWVQTVKGEYAKAEENLNYALILDPNLAAAYLNYGQWAEAQGLNEQAKENYKRAYTLDSGGSIGSLAGERYNQLVELEAQAAETPSETPNPEPAR